MKLSERKLKLRTLKERSQKSIILSPSRSIIDSFRFRLKFWSSRPSNRCFRTFRKGKLGGIKRTYKWGWLNFHFNRFHLNLFKLCIGSDNFLWKYFENRTFKLRYSSRDLNFVVERSLFRSTGFERSSKTTKR